MTLYCTNSECNYTETGKCVEGFEIAECSFVSDKPLEVSDNKICNTAIEENIGKRPEIKNDIFLHHGEKLGVEEAEVLLKQRPTKILAVIGPQGSGKTTFILSIYESFQQSINKNLSFSGSQTLIEFEKLCHRSRIASNRSKPDTPRTSISDKLKFLHFILNTKGENFNLLISDRAGEFYSSVANNEESIKELHEIFNCDCLLLLMDGEKYASEKRHGIKQDILMLLTTLIEEKSISHDKRIIIALSKYDYILDQPNSLAYINDFKEFIKTTQNRFKQSVEKISYELIASRSENSEVKSGYGINNILTNVLKKSPAKTYQPIIEDNTNRFYLL